MPALPRHLPRARCPGPGRAASSWAAAVADHARSGRHAAALTVFRRVLRAHPAVATSDQLAYAALLRCRDHRLAHQIHAQVCRRGLAASNPILACSLLAFYSEDPDKATMMFDEMPNPDAICYTAMMSALLRAGDWPRALALYPRMLRAAATPPTQHTFSKLLALCASMRLRRHGTQLHAQLLRWGCGAHLNLVLKTALVHMYASCGAMASARAVLQSTPETDVVLWTAIIAAYSRGGQLQAALGAFRDMERAAVPPNAFTYAALIAACSSAHALHIGRQLHARLFKSRLEHDTSACNALLDLYSKGASARLLDLLHAFRAVDTPNVVSWTAFIAGLARHGRDQDAFSAYARMRASGVQPNSFTLSTLLKGCTSAQAFLHAAKIHAYVLKTSFESLDAAVGNSLVDVYARFARMDDAWAVATTMPFIRDRFTYTSLAKGLNQMGLQHRALEMLVHMLHEEIDIDGFSLACFLSAAATMASMEHGKQLHCCSVKLGLSGQVSVSNSLIDMYSRCKCLEDANSAFRSIREPNVVSWNVLISGLVFNERYTEALSAFEDMILAGTQPDGITFSVVLSACSHGGLVDIGIKHFNSMRNLFGVFPQRSHYTCFLDMLGRAGRLTEAAHTIEAMPVQPDLSMYRTLLAFCKLHNDPVVGENIARKALELDPSDAVLQNMLPGIFGAPGDKIVMDRQVHGVKRGMQVSKLNTNNYELPFNF
ncbi:pentatricopeptide repeat-containing protein At5g52850, chloroplastic-like [Phragmites australis]|uniref:pentatricopeptide repeat-containing protein At5g52850, chloroplastic-like n=1 Tax=Phragmites australis TaxID=29695 RepID=UPI002D77B890|nr:pentatricopeptide repeat-containing protein At5g52850, chloroplastic-like [Phragmites australis]